MLSDNRVSLAPTPKQMNIENFILFLHSGIPFTKTDCPVKRICFFVYAENIFWTSLHRPHKMKGEMWQYNNFSYIFFRWESLLVENRLKIKVIVREHGEGILQSSYVLERVFRYYCYSSISALASAHGFSLISSKWKKIAVICIKHTCTRTINLQFFLLFPVAQVVECPFRGTGGHGFDPGPRHIKLVKNSTSCSPLGTQT